MRYLGTSSPSSDNSCLIQQGKVRLVCRLLKIASSTISICLYRPGEHEQCAIAFISFVSAILNLKELKTTYFFTSTPLSSLHRPYHQIILYSISLNFVSRVILVISNFFSQKATLKSNDLGTRMLDNRSRFF